MASCCFLAVTSKEIAMLGVSTASIKPCDSITLFHRSDPLYHVALFTNRLDYGPHEMIQPCSGLRDRCFDGPDKSSSRPF